MITVQNYVNGTFVSTKETIEERRSVILTDVESVKTRMAAAEKQIKDDTALLNALLGAMQQCDNFLKEFDDVLSDDGNDEKDNEE